MKSVVVCWLREIIDNGNQAKMVKASSIIAWREKRKFAWQENVGIDMR